MEKKTNGRLVFLILVITILGCKTSNLPKHKKYQQMETFIEINGLKIPTLSEDKKFFKDTKAFKNDRKNSIGSGEASEMYKENDDWQDNNDNMNSYQKATKDYLIKQPDNTFEDIVYDKSNLYNNKYDLKRYNFKDDILKSVSNIWMIYRDLKEEVLVNEIPTKQVVNKLTSSCQYFPNAKLKSFSIYFGNLINNTNSAGLFNAGNECYIGTWYKFNESGNIIQTIDFEKNYKTNFLDIFSIARKKLNELSSKGKPDLFQRGYPGFQRNKNENGAFWQLFISPYYFMIIDDATGKVIEEVESADYDEVQKNFSKYMNPTIKYENAIKEFFQN
jgi:hypothetical protein